MPMLHELLKRSCAGQPLWLSDVREAFAAAGESVPLVLQLRSFDGRTRDFRHALPRWRSDAERRLVRNYLCAAVYNAMSACGGYELRLYTDFREQDMLELISELPEFFQVSSPKRKQAGRVVNIADRMGRAFGRGAFSMTVSDLGEYVAAPPVSPKRGGPKLAEALRTLCDSAEGANLVGVDVGGTDIKLAASANGRLIAVKEYDWNPAAFLTVERIIGPILLLTRLMRACIAAESLDSAHPLRRRVSRALRRDAGVGEMEAASAEAEALLGAGALDAIGVSFPDIVLQDRIVGGETPKTDGIRRNRDVDYETEFSKLSALKEALLPLCRGRGRCHIVNDGSMAAFAAAMELACGDSPELIENGVVAHSLGTDLGTGWLDADGSIPQLPLECYDLWLDLGSAPSVLLPPEDLRSTRSESSGIPSVRRFLGQAAAYRLAWEIEPHLLDGFTEERSGILRIRVEPEDLRKPCLEHLMRLADEGNANAEEVFRRIGRNLAAASREIAYLLEPETDVRFLFGRFVKSVRCFELLREGCAETAPRFRLENGGEDLANTPLMRQLASRTDVTVAQFAQAVGAIYFALSE